MAGTFDQNDQNHLTAQKEIARNLTRVHEKIAAAAQRAGRAVSSIRLIAVSKTKPLEFVRAALAAGQHSFGENYVQEAVEKVAGLPEADWHFIGSLQTNKAKQVVGRFSLIHSVDRIRLADELAKAAAAEGVVQDVLVQVRVGDEETKHGADIAEGAALLAHISRLSALRPRGVMALPPLSEDESVARGYFAQVRRAFEEWRSIPGIDRLAFTELSLGTSSDYEWAILEGATMVRVGTAIFGARQS